MKKIMAIGVGMILFCVLAAGICLVAGLYLYNNGGKEIQIYHKISSVEELYAMKSNRCYQLTCDIDLQEREWYPLEVKGFNGNGYTIKNSYTNETTDYYSSGFFTKVKWLDNTVFENIQMNITFTDSKRDYWGGSSTGDNCGGIVVGDAEEIDGIIVRNSSAVINIGWDNNLSQWAYIGGIAGDGVINNSTFEESSLTCIITSDHDLEIGGIVGCRAYGKESLFNNKVIKSTITAKSDGRINCGGIVGRIDVSDGTVENCFVKDSIFDAQSSDSSTSRMGGIVGFCEDRSEVNNCASSNNNIKLTSSYGYNIGGIVGKADGRVINCLSDFNELQGVTHSTDSKQFACVGGLCGSSNTTVAKSVSQNNRIVGTDSTKSKSMFAAGFIASVGGSVVDCLCYNIGVQGGYSDVFSDQNKDLLFNCFITERGQITPNINNLPVLSYKNWQEVIEKLSLDKDLWTCDSGFLNLKIAE